MLRIASFPSGSEWKFFQQIRDIHCSRSGRELSTAEEKRIIASTAFLAGCEDDYTFLISDKSETVGCDDASKQRVDLVSAKVGVAPHHEVKSLLYCSNDGREILYLVLPASKEVNPVFNKFYRPLTEPELADFDLIPYTVNPGSFLYSLSEENLRGRKVDVVVDPDLLDKKLQFLTNNAGSRFVSVSMSVEHFSKSFEAACDRAKEKFDDKFSYCSRDVATPLGCTKHQNALTLMGDHGRHR